MSLRIFNWFKPKEVKPVECEACKAYKDHVFFLRSELERQALLNQDERAEYKRAMDALLLVLKAPAIGQGHVERSAPLDMKTLMGFLEEEKPQPSEKDE